MDKQQLLEFVQTLPDNLEVMPISFDESKQEYREWEPQYRSTDLGGVYQCNVDNILTLRFQFMTRYQGEFMRTYNDPDGSFRNLHRVK